MICKPYPGIGEELYSGVLENGLRVFVLPKPGFRSYYAAFAVNYGGAHRRFTLDGTPFDTPAGVAHYLEHKMFDMPDGDNALDRLTANGAEPNAFTSAGMTCYHFSCADRFEENLRLLLHFVSTPYFTEETVQKERGIIGQEIRMGDDSPGYAVYFNLLHQLYASHPVRDRVDGTLESIAQITHETLYACHRMFYTPANMCLCVAGDVDPERIAATAAELLSPEKSSVPEADFGPEEDLLPVEALHTVSMPVSAPQFCIGLKLRAARGAEALRQRIVAQLVMRLLAGPSSSFYNSLYAEGTLNRDYGYDVYFAADAGMLLVEGESEDPARVLGELKRTVSDAAEHGFDPALFERAKRASYGARLRGLEDFESVCLSLASSAFEGFCSLDALQILGEVGKGECEDFVRSCLLPERFAMSVVEPAKEA